MFLFPGLSSPGLHYIGQVHENSLLRIAFDQLSEGQLEFQELNQHFDTIQIGLGDEKREYTILSGKTEMKAHLMKQFPDDTEAIEKFFKIMKVLFMDTYFSVSTACNAEICFKADDKRLLYSTRSQPRKPTTWQL